MVQTLVAAQGLSDSLAAVTSNLVKRYTIAAPNTTITNRAQVTDFSRDLLPRMGINRIMTETFQEVPNEFGSNSEKVYKVPNDIHDQIRFVGSDWSAQNSSNGQSVIGGGNVGSYVEVVFYGTGLNLLTNFYNSNWSTTSLFYSIDGAAGVVIPNLSSTFSSTLNGRNYSSNQVLQVVSGLTLGMHTVRILLNAGIANGWSVYGVEVLNTSGTSPNTLQLVPGVSYANGVKNSATSLVVDSYNTNFESGALGTRGGHVVVYQKSDGTVKKAVQPTDASSLTLSSTSHTNEDVIRIINFREFGAGRTDDFSFFTGANNPLAFTLDDGTTTLQCSTATIDTGRTGDNFFSQGSSTSFTFMFVGTGLDLYLNTDVNNRNDLVSIDGSSIGSTGTVPQTQGQMKVVSGLPYGTHTFKMTSQSGSSTTRVQRFVVYGPKKPSIPAGAVELGDYYLMANYSATSAWDILNGPLSTGILFKVPLREMVYVGASWTASAVTNAIMSAQRNQVTANGDYMEYTFYGTGIELSMDSSGVGACTATIQMDGSAYTGAALVASSANGSWTPGTSTFSINSTAAAQLQITGLTLGAHRIRMTKASGTGLYVEGVNIVTPIHSPKYNTPADIQSTLPVGSHAIGDSRNFGSIQAKSLSAWSQAIGVTSNPTTTSTSLVPMIDMACPIRTTGGALDISYSIEVFSTGTTVSPFAQVYVDGFAVGTLRQVTCYTPASTPEVIADRLIVPVAAGFHIVQLFWGTNTGTAFADVARRDLVAKEMT